MLYLTMLGSALFWTLAAVAFSRNRRVLAFMDRMGRWFFAACLVLTLAVWLLVPVARADRAGDPQVTTEIPVWYDGLLETWIPNSMLAVAATGAWGATGAGLFLRFKLYSLFGFNWYYLAVVVPWSVSARAHDGSFGRTGVSAYSITSTDIWPLILINGASLALFLGLYAFITSVERQYKSYALPRRDVESAA